MNEPFYFTITDFARLIGKSPVTCRGWERQGLIKFPRDEGGDRKFTCEEVISSAYKVHRLKRITKNRLRLVEGAMATLQFLEAINRHKKRKK